MNNKRPVTPKKIFVIMAGGTGGHIFPGLAVAEVLQAQGFTIHWLGAKKGMETTLVPKYGIAIDTLSIKGFNGKGVRAFFLAPWYITLSIIQAWFILKKIKPAGVLGMGGFAAGPGSIAAKILKIPIMIHEQNAIMGLTNRLTAPLAKKIFLAFPSAAQNRKKTIVTGNPVRQTIVPSTTTQDHYQSRSPRLLILGGSRGAVFINQLIPKTLARLPYVIDIWHQTGAHYFKETQQNYKEHALKAHAVPFIDHMGEAYTWADVVICRSGALTVSELTIAGKPSILIPYPWHKDQQQQHNAEFLLKNNAAYVLEQKMLTDTVLAQFIHRLLQDYPLLHRMGQAALACAQPNAAATIARMCGENICEQIS